MSLSFQPLSFGGLIKSVSGGPSFITKVGEGLEVVSEELKIKTGGITLAMLSTAVQTKLGEIKTYSAKAAGGLDLSGTEFLLKAKGITGGMYGEGSIASTGSGGPIAWGLETVPVEALELKVMTGE